MSFFYIFWYYLWILLHYFTYFLALFTALSTKSFQYQLNKYSHLNIICKEESK